MWDRQAGDLTNGYGNTAVLLSQETAPTQNWQNTPGATTTQWIGAMPK